MAGFSLPAFALNYALDTFPHYAYSAFHGRPAASSKPGGPSLMQGEPKDTVNARICGKARRDREAREGGE